MDCLNQLELAVGNEHLLNQNELALNSFNTENISTKLITDDYQPHSNKIVSLTSYVA